MNKTQKLKKNYKKGEILLSEEPFVFLLKSDLNKERCDQCFKRNQLLKCSGCSFVHYCDQVCQKKGWYFHKFECSNIKRLMPRLVPNAARMMARIIIKLQKGGASEKSYYTETKFRVFRDLMSHYNEIKKDLKRMEHFVSLSAVLHEFLEDQYIPNEAELLAIYGKMVVNTFNILDSEMQSIGTGMYLAASVIDHCCSPNAVAVFNGTKISIRTLVDIESLDWMKVHISYIDVLDLPSARQKELQSTYYFLCECEKCLDLDELHSMTATICQNKQCNKCIKGGGLENTLKCPHCDQLISEETKNKISEVVQFSQEQINNMQNLAYLDICRVCLQKQENLLHSSNIYKVKVTDFAVEGCIGLENWESALEYGQQIIKPLKKYYGDLHPLRGIFLMKMGKISSLLGKITDAVMYFKEAASILTITHGPEHPLVKNDLVNCIRNCQIEVSPKIFEHQQKSRKLSVKIFLKMETSKTSINTNKSDRETKNKSIPPETSESSKFSKLSTRNILSAIGSRFFSGNSESSETKKEPQETSSCVDEKSNLREKNKKEEKTVDKILLHNKAVKKLPTLRKLRGDEPNEHVKKGDREFRRFKTKYNNGIGNIMRHWMGLIYCILILRMNLIKFILQKFPDFDHGDFQLQNQILLESRTMYNLIRKAQHLSQERTLYLWTQLEKLIFNRMLLKNSLEVVHSKELAMKDWKGAAAKLTQVQAELEKAQNFYKTIQRSKNQVENAGKEKLMKLESLTNTKNAELEQLIEQITECKKREVQMRGKILLNMKSYKDLKTKRQYLMNVEKEMNQLKNDQTVLVKEYSSKIESLKSKIEEKERQIKHEKEERKKIRASLDGFGDYFERRSMVALAGS